MFLPCSAQLNTTVRNRLGRIADKISNDDAHRGDAGTNAAFSPLTVFLDGAHIRCRPEYQKRHLDVVVGKVESLNMSRRFGLVQQAAASPARQLRNDLIAQGWDGQSKVTVILDGQPNLVQGTLRSKGFSGLPLLFERTAETLRWYLWHGKVMTAATILNGRLTVSKMAA